MIKLTNDEIGRIIGTVQTSSFEMILDPTILRDHPPEIGEYITIQYGQALPGKPVLGMITSLAIRNENYLQNLIRRPESLDRLNILGDLSEGEILTANVQVLGYLERENILLPRFPPIPGSKVTRAPKDLLEKIFQIGEAEIGIIRSHSEIPVSLDLNMLVSRHFAILAITGAGKSNSVAVLVADILRKVQGSIIIIDPHNDYFPLINHPELKDRVFIFSTEPRDHMHRLCFKYSSFGPEEICEMLRIPQTATRQRGLVIEAIDSLEDDWDLETLHKAIKECGDFPKNVRFSVLNRLKIFPERVFLTKTQETPIYDVSSPSLVKPNQVSIFALGGIGLRTQQAAVAQLLQKVFYGAYLNRSSPDEPGAIPVPILTVIEEAHNFCGAKGGPAISPISKIVSEGRKFGVGLGIVSQRPGKINSDVLSQCNTQFIMRIVNPIDQRQIRESVEAISEELIDDLPGLNKGEAIIVGPSLPLPALVKIHRFEGDLGGSDIDIVGEWRSAAKNRPVQRVPKYDHQKVDYQNVDY